MGTRVTRAAEQVSAEVIQQRMQAEASAWRRRYWHIIWLALTAPRQAEEIARQAGVSVVTVHRVLARYRRGGVAAIEGTRKGGRRHGCLPLSEEAAFLAPFAERAAARGARAGGGDPAGLAHAPGPGGAPRHRRALAGCGTAGAGETPLAVRPCLARSRRDGRGAAGEAACATLPPLADRSRRPPPARAAPRAAALPVGPDGPGVGAAGAAAAAGQARQDVRARPTCARCSMPCSTWTARDAQWRALPKDFPPWSTVWTYFRQWRNDGTWQRLHTALREQVRVKGGREPTPSAAIIDSQSVKTSQKGGPRLRRWQEGQGAQAPHPGRYERLDPAGAGA